MVLKSGFCSYISDSQDRVNVVLKRVEPLSRRHFQQPSNQGRIHAIIGPIHSLWLRGAVETAA